ncbi:acyl-CoA thioester hydrolase [Lentibacillus persicus]|uniref:Acyl-CoA thioester hydrolase n=1 Tax=Lentibacillus persicus TaxID=640948 RepID=A0A1I1V5G9_9BACI|nr:thioesterase family protein [Lentibacillus persicus]SFD78292.1 acyl-CoA thioester hydrolase [Lentibacillus persicus]
MHKINTPVEVRYQETDQMGVVYHANYLVWFEIGRTKYIESLGFTYTDMEKNDIVSPVVDAQINFNKPVHYGEQAFVETWIESYDGIRTVYANNIFREDGDVAVSGTTKHVIVNKKSFRPLSLRKAFPEWHRAYLRQVSGDA